jgi:DNA-binding beta-propeller fold protein YncE
MAKTSVTGPQRPEVGPRRGALLEARRSAAGVLAAALACASCGGETTPTVSTLGNASQALQLGSTDDETSDPVRQTLPAADYTLFEADPVRPVAVLDQNRLIAVTNGVDDYLELVRIGRGGTLTPCGGTRVGLRPVAVAMVSETGPRRERAGAASAELWVVNHVSDDISVVRVDGERCEATVIDTLYVGDEPRDIVVAPSKNGGRRVFVAAAHRGQHHPVASARSGRDLVTPAGAKDSPGLGDVFVFDAAERSLLGVVNLFSEAPRALAVGNGVVYAAGFHTGNRTTAIIAETVLSRGLGSLEPLLLVRDGQFVEQAGELLLVPGAGAARIRGGMPAVVGQGRCMPDPRDDHADRSLAQVCVETDAQHHPLRVLVQQPGQVSSACQCTSGDGTLQPTTSVIVQFHDSQADCGEDFTTFPDGLSGCWLDAAPGGVVTPASHADRQATPMAWNDVVRFSLPDRDVFAIGVDDLAVEREVTTVGTIVYGLAVQPGGDRVFAANTDAKNLTRFEGSGAAASTTVQGHLHESRISVIDGNDVTPVHLNDHIDYGRCCERDELENARSLALPTSLAFSPDGRHLYFTALGSDKVAMVRTSRLGRRFANVEARSRGWLEDVQIGSEAEPAGPVGLAVDPRNGNLYVKTHFSNELVAIDPDRAMVIDRVAFASPEPPSITRGRPILYDTRRTSSHGDSSCGTCHVFGNFDGLAWDLGDPDGVSVKNPGPFAQAPAIFGLAGLSADPFRRTVVGRIIDEDFRTHKGPMSTQTLRGLANHGAQHWRGDRTRRFQTVPGAQPDVGSLDEENSFGEFDVAIVGLNGNDRQLPASDFQDFTNFALQLTLPPNPVRALDDSLTPAQRRARAAFFGCASMTDEQYEARQCVALDGALVDIDPETRACVCQKNPLHAILRDLPRAMSQLSELLPAFSDAAQRRALVDAATVVDGVPEVTRAALIAIAAELDAALAAIGGADFGSSARGLIAEETSVAIARLESARASLRAFSAVLGLNLDARLLEAMLVALRAAETVPFADSPEALAAGLALTVEVGRVSAAVSADDAVEGTAAYRDLLTGCEVNEPVTCRMRVFETFATCNGCHTLDPRGNAEFDVYRPGFFGTNGQYSFENESQIFKVPHLRNAYAKAGMFGASEPFIFVSSSVLGERRGGFFGNTPPFHGEQVRGYGYLHDGAVDTVHHFLGTTPFAVRAPGALNPRDPGTVTAFHPFLPGADSRQTCLGEFRRVSDAAFEQLPAPLRPALTLCRESSPVPDVCFLEPSSQECRLALTAISDALGNPEFSSTFFRVRPLCFQMGSMLEGGLESGACFPEGLRERAEMEDFIIAFDSNLKPMVGQQVTLQGGRRSHPELLASMLTAARRGDCDIALRAREKGYLMTRPDPRRPDQSRLIDARGGERRLAELEARGEPLTLTCHPPQAEQAEARRSAFSR